MKTREWPAYTCEWAAKGAISTPGWREQFLLVDLSVPLRALGGSVLKKHRSPHAMPERHPHEEMVVRSVNYFGHAAVASWKDSAPGVVLGSMIPDFSTMSGARVTHIADTDVATGIALHHTTDAAFHTLPAVTGLMRELDDALLARNCARGPRRAVAHIGIELMLDGILVREPVYREAYTRGLAYDPRGAEWKDAGDDARFAKLIERLRSYGVPDDLQRVDAIVHRLSRILGPRPLLAPSSDDLRAIAAGLSELQPRVEVATETVLRGLRAQLTP